MVARGGGIGQKAEHAGGAGKGVGEDDADGDGEQEVFVATNV